jgi:6-phosphofructokinase 1
MKTYNVVVGQSGGPTPVINASLRGVVEQALKAEQVDRIYGTPNGLSGILRNELIGLNGKLPQIRQAARQPGAVLGTSRHPLHESEYERIIANLEQADVKVFCYIGGNGSSRTVLALAEYARSKGKDIRFVHIPKTIDNDLDGTDHTPGYGSAAKFLSHMTQWFAVDMVSLQTVPKIEIIEVMGGNRGWLPAASALFKTRSGYPNLVYLPDKPVEAATILNDVESVFQRKESMMMMVPDHLRVNGLPTDPLAVEDRLRGNNTGIGFRLSQHITRTLGIPTRTTVPYALYRIAPGAVSAVDIEEAYQLGAKAVEYAAAGYTGGMVSLERVSAKPYLSRIRWVALDGVAGQEKTFPAAYWNADEHRPTAAFADYLLPLIDGETPDCLFSLSDLDRKGFSQ